MTGISRIKLVCWLAALVLVPSLAAAQTALDVAPSGNVGIGVVDATEKLEVQTTSGKLSVEPNGNFSVELHSSGALVLDAGLWSVNLRVGGVDRLYVAASGRIGIGTTSPAGTLDVNGGIYQRGGVLHSDYVFAPDYPLEPIEEHAEFMWRERHLPALAPRQVDEENRELVEIGAQRRGMLEELEKAHIYIERLHERLAEEEERLAVLERQNAERMRMLERENRELSARLARLESSLGTDSPLSSSVGDED